jgi:cyclic dehypoxanthinyl futalosine synthase
MERQAINNLKRLVYDGIRLKEQELEEIFALPLPTLSHYSRLFTRVQLGERAKYVTYIVDCNINYTNFCTTACKFCAFYVPYEDKDGWYLSVETIVDRCRQVEKLGATQIMLQGGHYAKLPISYYTEVFSRIKAETSLWIHSLGPSELHFLSKTHKISIDKLIEIFQDAGLDSVAGAGAEILAEPTRKRIAPLKESGKRWLEIMESVHNHGMRSSVTMLMCVGESISERIEHLSMIRNLQDKTNGFNSFIPYVFQPFNNKLKYDPGYYYIDYLKMIAIGRLFLDNIKHLQGSWLTTSDELCSMSLNIGADDVGSIMLEENVVSSAGAKNRMTLQRLLELIEESDKTPAIRDSSYEMIGKRDDAMRQVKSGLRSHIFSKTTTKSR